MRRFGITDLNEIDCMTFREFRLRMKAYELKRLDKEYQIALLAWQIREIDARTKSGKNNYKYVYDRFEKFFNFEEHENMILNGVKRTESKKNSPMDRYKEYLRNKQCQGTT